MRAYIFGLLGALFLAAVPLANPAVAQSAIKVSAPGTSVAAVAPVTFTGDLCGNHADLAIKVPAADANPELTKFLGVWGMGEWDNKTCLALAVTEVNGNTATIQYFYGAGAPPDSTVPGSFIKTDAVMKGKYLSFNSMKGYLHSYELAGGELKGWVGMLKTSKKLQKLK